MRTTSGLLLLCLAGGRRLSPHSGIETEQYLNDLLDMQSTSVSILCLSFVERKHSSETDTERYEYDHYDALVIGVTPSLFGCRMSAFAPFWKRNWTIFK